MNSSTEKQKQDLLDKEISQLTAEGYHVDKLEDRISLLHEYNDIKDRKYLQIKMLLKQTSCNLILI